MDNSVRERVPGAIAQCVSKVVRSRRAVRAFRPLPLDRKLVEDILEDAATAPSGANIQPWRVYVVSGSVKDELADASGHPRGVYAAAPTRRAGACVRGLRGAEVQAAGSRVMKCRSATVQ